MELSTDATWRQEFYARRGQSNIILSWHDFSGTPETGRLVELLAEMLAAPADIVKMVTRAARPDDNLRVLSLIPRDVLIHVYVVQIASSCLRSVERVRLNVAKKI